MSKQNESHSKIYCFENECAFWDEEMKMCCIKSAMIAGADKKNGGSSPTAQAYYIPPSSCCYTDARSNIELETDLIDNLVYNGGL
jgi:hypothetical protein